MMITENYLRIFEEKLITLSGGSFELIKRDNFYIKIYTKGILSKMNAKFWKLIERDGKEYRKPLRNPDNLIGKNFEGEAVFLIDNIYIIKN